MREISNSVARKKSCAVLNFTRFNSLAGIVTRSRKESRSLSLSLTGLGWVDLGGWLNTELFICLQAVTHPSTNPAQCRVTSLIESDAFPLSHVPL